MFAPAVPAVATLFPVAPELVRARSDISTPIPPPVAWKPHRRVIPFGPVTVELLGTANIPTKRSELSPPGTFAEGAVMLVELALAMPVLKSIGVTLLTPA